MKPLQSDIPAPHPMLIHSSGNYNSSISSFSFLTFLLFFHSLRILCLLFFVIKSRFHSFICLDRQSLIHSFNFALSEFSFWLTHSFIQEYILFETTIHPYTFKTCVLRSSSVVLETKYIYDLTIPTSPTQQVPSTTSKCITRFSFQPSSALAPWLSLNTNMHTYTQRKMSSSTRSGKKVLTPLSKSS